MPPVPFILIADDYALTDGVSRAIIELLAQNRLSGTGAMTNQPAWPEAAKALLSYRGRADLGLHLTLTLGKPLGPMPGLAPQGYFPAFGGFLKKALLGGLSKPEIMAEIMRQIEEFEQKTGFLPDFIDGHQHVHVLPIVRSALFEAVDKLRPGWRPWLRMPGDSFGAIMARGVSVGKALVIAGLAQGFASAARRRGFRLNDTFSGVSDFEPDADYSVKFRRYVLVSGKRHLVMCHPGHSDAALAALDPVTAARDREYDFLVSDAFLALLSEMNLQIGHFPA
jgi:chitin disaccharide deacetylase